MYLFFQFDPYRDYGASVHYFTNTRLSLGREEKGTQLEKC
jgi:hypothetical protein